MFLIAGTASAFASDNVENFNKTDANEGNCIHVTYSCCVETDICNFTGTLQQLGKMLQAQDDLICGGSRDEPVTTIIDKSNDLTKQDN